MAQKPNFSELFADSHEAEQHLCTQIRLGIHQKQTFEEVAQLANACYHSCILDHFQKEEILLQALPKEDLVRKKTRNRQKRLRGLQKKLHTLPRRKAVTLALIEEELQLYIRFERKELFPYLESYWEGANWDQIESKLN
ncbi:MAG: hypothetical protein AAF587_25900 [Bacteroidota bacterium]